MLAWASRLSFRVMCPPAVLLAASHTQQHLSPGFPDHRRPTMILYGIDNIRDLFGTRSAPQPAQGSTLPSPPGLAPLHVGCPGVVSPTKP